jgi:hypothetical protein
MSTQPINYEPATTQLRVQASLTKEIDSVPEDIFPLACPVEELRWIPGWDYRLLYSASGVNETNCMFTEKISGPHIFSESMKTVWTTVVHDPENKMVLFHIQLGQKASIRFKVTFRKVGLNTSCCTWDMVLTALDKQTSEMAADDIQGKLASMMMFLSECLKYYCENGEILPSNHNI